MNIKLTSFLIVIAVMRVSAITFAQQVTLKKDNISLEVFLKEVKKQTGYNYVMFANNIGDNVIVNADFKNTQLADALSEVLKGKDLAFTINKKTIVVQSKDKSLIDRGIDLFKQITVHGRVVDEKGNPMPGANIALKSRQQRTSTNGNGDFQLNNVDEKDSVQITFTGYKSIILPVKADMGTIVMAIGNEALKEVVVTSGYQTILKERAAGSFDHIGSDVLSKRPVSDISTALQGLAAGVQGKENSDGTLSYLIRGTSSLYAATAPLVVVDGFPIQNAAGTNADFSSINPNDVESIDILKDATAASIWGARSANGVIVITTKKGKGNKGLTINASIFSKVSTLTDLNQYLLTANSSDMVKYEKLAYQNNWIYPGGMYQGGSVFPSDITKSLTSAQQLIYANKYGQINTAAMNKGLDSLSEINNHDQINKYLVRRQSTQQYNVSLSDNTERSSTYASILFENNQTRYQGTGYNRVDINLRNEYRIAKFLTFNFSTFLQYTDQKSSGATDSEIQALSPYETLVNLDGTYSPNVMNGFSLPAWFLLPTSKFPYADQSYNLLREVRGRDLDSKNFLVRIQTGLLFKILPGLNFNTSLQYERGKIDISNYYSDNTYYTRNRVDNYVQYNNTTKTVGTAYLPKGGILQDNYTNSSNYVFRNQLNFNKSWGKNSITALAAAEITQNRSDFNTPPWLYGYNPTTLTSITPPYGYGSSVDQLYTFTSTVPNATLSGGNTVFSYSLNRYVSALANVAYTYDDKYTLTGSIRSDASNYVTKIPSLRWSPFWTIGGKWNVIKENFAKDWNVFDQLSLRATYGKRGNTVTSTSTNTLLSVGTSPSTVTGTIVATIADNGNPTLRWERTSTTNLAVDYSLFKNKLYGSIEFYNSVGKDITGTIALPAATGTTNPQGLSTQKFNNAGIVNRGVELTIGNRGQFGSTGIGYNSTFNFAYNDNKITNLYYPNTLASAMLNPATTYIQGKPLNAVYAYVYTGMQNGLPTVQGPNGTIIPFEGSSLFTPVGTTFLRYMGTATPPYTVGWRPSLSFKNFSLTALFTGTFGGVYSNEAFNYSSAYVGFNKTSVNKYVSNVFAGDPNMPGFAPDNDANLYSWSVGNFNTLVESSSYVQCKDVLLDYTLSKTAFKRSQIKNVRIYLEATNLGLVWAANKNSYNPDWLPGTERPLAIYTLGLNVGF